MNERDFEEMLKKQLEASDTDGDVDDEQEAMKYITGILSLGSMVELGKAARNRIEKVIKDLKKDISKNISSAMASIKIQNAAKELKILYIILSATTFTGVTAISGSEKSMDDVIEDIVRLGTM